MKKLVAAVAIVLVAIGVAVYAQGPGYGPGWGHMGPGPGWGQAWGPGWGPGMGPGMMGGYYGPYGSPEYGPGHESITLEQAKEIAKQYTDKYLKGFTVEHVLPYTGMRHMMYGVELKGPKGEVRYLRINPWGGVVPFVGGPWAAQER